MSSSSNNAASLLAYLNLATTNIYVDWVGTRCDGHPTVATHERMGERLVEELALHLSC
ncbi:MAG: hypothetical protein K0V04_43240 [Deltaproteobacteria bacterium]|nr:hypothetical protein [Deltaproteobacteria bacterium]